MNLVESRRSPKPVIDELRLIDAAEHLVEWCFGRTIRRGNIFIARIGFLQLGVETVQATGPGGEDESWISRIRLTKTGNPFKSTTGIEIRMPYGINTCGIEDPANPYSPLQSEAVEISYPFDGMGWNGQPVKILENGCRRDVSLLADTVGQIDEILVRDHPGSIHEWAGFTLGEALWNSNAGKTS